MGKKEGVFVLSATIGEEERNKGQIIFILIRTNSG